MSTFLEKIADPHWETRFIGYKEAGKSGNRSLLDTALRGLNDDKSKVRLAAAWAAGELGNPTIAETLVSALADPDEWVRVTLVEALGKVADAKICLILSQFLENEESEKVRATIIKVIGHLGDEGMVPIICQYLQDSDHRVTANAVEALGRLSPGHESVADRLIHLMSHHNNRIKANAAKVLYDLGRTQEAYSALLEMLHDPHPSMMASAAFMLGEIKNPRAIPILLAHLTNDTWIVRKNLLTALRKLCPLNLEAVVRGCDDPDPRVRVGAVWVLGVCRHEDPARRALIYALQDENGEVRAKAEEMLDEFTAGLPIGS